MYTKNTRFSGQAGLAMLGSWFRHEQIWQLVEQQVTVRQKTVLDSPTDKLLDALIHIMTGAQRMVTINTGLRDDELVQRAFGRKRCAEQSSVSTTLTRCDEANVAQMRQVQTELLRRYGASRRHRFKQRKLLLDVDTSGLLAGKQAEKSEKGFFSAKKGGRGRQIGRIIASDYGEIVVDRLYGGKRQLEKTLLPLVEAAAQTLNLTPKQRQRSILRMDAGGGSDTNFNQLFEQGYGVLGKVHNWQRCHRLSKLVETWYQDPQDPSRQIGIPSEQVTFCVPTRQVVVRRRKPNKKQKNGVPRWALAVIVTNLSDSDLRRLARQGAKQPEPTAALWTLVKAYDKRGGGIETAFREDKQALGLSKRNKRSFVAQETLLLLTQMAHNLLVWARRILGRTITPWRAYGIKRFIRDVLCVPGQAELTASGHLIGITFRSTHPASRHWCCILPKLAAFNEMYANLGKF